MAITIVPTCTILTNCGSATWSVRSNEMCSLEVIPRQVSAQGHFHLGTRWLSMGDPINRELVVNAIHKYQNTWPDSLEARAYMQCPAAQT